jgi:hypothetical protein
MTRDAVRRDRARRDRARRDRARDEPAGLAGLPGLDRMGGVRASGLAEPGRAGRHLARAAQQLPVVVFLGVYRSV